MIKLESQKLPPSIKKISPSPADLNLIDDIQKLIPPSVAVEKVLQGSMFNYKPKATSNADVKSIPLKS